MEQSALRMSLHEPCNCMAELFLCVAVSSDKLCQDKSAGRPISYGLPDTLAHLETALEHVDDVMRLSHCPLTQTLDLGRFAQAGDDPWMASGLKLHRALHNIIDLILQSQRPSLVDNRTWKVHHYLHLRYRCGIQHKDIAHALDYSERQMARFRSEQIRQVAQCLNQLSKA